jgi:hypothetical protein
MSFPLLGFAVGAAASESVSYGVDVGVGASDNIGLVATNPRSEVIGEAGLDFNVQRVNTRLDVNATGDFAFLDYLHHTYSNQTVGRFDGTGSFGIIPERLVWVLQDDFGQAQLDPFAAVNPANLQNINYLQTGPDLTLHLSSTAFLMLSARYARATYEVSPFDSNSVTGAIAVGRELSRRSKLSLNFKYERLRFDDTALQADANTSSLYGRYEAQFARMTVAAELGGTRVTGPVGSNSGALAHLDATRRLSPFTDLTVSFAHELTDASSSFSSFRPGAIGGIQTAPVAQSADTYKSTHGDAQLRWQRTRTTVAVSGRYERDVYDRQFQLDLTRAGVELSVERRLTPHFSALVHASYYRTDYLHVDFLSNDRLFGGALKWRFGRDMELSLRYDHTARDASGVGVSYRENRAFLNIAYRPPGWQSK